MLTLPEIEEQFLNDTIIHNISSIMEEDYMKEIIEDIEERGIDYPAVGDEGNHRAIAHWYLKRPLPYLEMIPDYSSGR